MLAHARARTDKPNTEYWHGELGERSKVVDTSPMACARRAGALQHVSGTAFSRGPTRRAMHRAMRNQAQEVNGIFQQRKEESIWSESDEDGRGGQGRHA